MSTAETAAAIIAAKGHVTKVTDEATVLAGETATLPDTAVSAVEPLSEAMGGHVETLTTEALAANAQLDVALAALAGHPVPSPSPTPPPAKPDLILERSNVTAPEDLPVGTLDGTLTITGVLRAPPADGKWRKLIGPDSTQGAEGGFCVGLTNDGKLEAWVDDSTKICIATLPVRTNLASFFSFRLIEATSTMVPEIDAATVKVEIPQGWVEFDGAACIGAGFYDHKKCDPITGAELLKLRVYREQLTEAQIDADQKEWAKLIDPDAPPGPVGPPPSSGLEPIDNGAAQLAVKADAAERQTIQGFGAGFGPIQELDRVFPRMKSNAQTDFDNIRLKLARIIWSGDGGTLGRAYKPVIDWARDRVASYGEKLHVHATWFQYNNGNPTAQGDAFAASIKAGIDTGCQIDSGSLCNEPGGTNKHIPDNEYVPSHKQARLKLDSYGLNKFVITGLEYPKDSLDPLNDNCRHFYDKLNEAGLIPSAVPIGAVHCYGDCTTVELADKWGKLGIMQLEAGFGMNPGVGCRIVNDLNKNVNWWSYHLLQAFNADAKGDYGQKLVDMNGNPNSYYRSYQAISTRFLPGTVMRRCTVNGAMPYYTEHNKSGAFVACGKRADGKWVIAVQSNSGSRQQFTVQVPVAANGQLTGVRINSGGSSATPVGYALVDGYTRLTLSSNELAVVVG